MAKFILTSSNLVTCDSNTARKEILPCFKQSHKGEAIQCGANLSSVRKKGSCPKKGIRNILYCSNQDVIDCWSGFVVSVKNPEKLVYSIIQLIDIPDRILLPGLQNAQIREGADREKHITYRENLYKQLFETYQLGEYCCEN